MIRVESLDFDYGAVRALHDISFEIREGSVVALVGPNGSGKTTLMRSIAGLQTPASGRVFVGGLSVSENPRKVHRQIGFLPDFYGLYGDLKIRHSLEFHAGAKKLAREDAEAAIDWAVRSVGLEFHPHQLIRELSRGNSQRLAIAQAILHKPRTALLDEPASGLDPEARRQLSQLIRSLHDVGMTLVVSSHILHELEEYATHVMVLREGRLVSFEGLSASNEDGRRVIEIRLSEPQTRFAEILGAEAGVSIQRADSQSASIELTGEPSSLLAKLVDEGFGVEHFSTEGRSVQQVYFD